MLQKDTVSINIANSLDQKTDSKLIQPNRLAGVKNRRFKKVGRLDKRPGQEALSTTVTSSYTDPLTIGASDGKSSLQPYQDQLTLDNKGAFYSRRDLSSSWAFKNHSSYVDVEVSDIQSPTNYVFAADSIKVGSVTIVISRAVVDENLTQDLYCSVFVTSTGEYLSKNTLVASNIRYARVVTNVGKAHIVFSDGTNIKRCTVNTSTGAVGAASTLKTDVSGTTGTLDVFPIEDTLAGDVIVCAYRRTSDINIMLLDTDGAEITTPANVQISGTTGILDVYHHASLGANRFFVADSRDTGLVRTSGFDIGAGSITTVYGPTTLISASATSLRNDGIAQSYDPASGNLIIFLDSAGILGDVTSAGELNVNPIESPLRFAEVSSSGSVVTSVTTYALGLRLAARPFIDDSRETILIPCIYDSFTSSAFVLCDFNKGRSPREFFAQAKWFYGFAQSQPRANYIFGAYSTSGQSPAGPLPNCYEVEDGTYSFVGLTRNDIVGATGLLSPVVGTVATDRIAYNIGLSIHSLTLGHQSSKSSLSLNKALIQSGAVLSHYDGSNFVEHGFVVDPEILWANVYTSPLKFTFTDGTGGTPATLAIVCSTGVAWSALTGTSYYFTWDTPGTDYYIWFTIDGVGNDPAVGGRSGIQVNVLTSQNPGEIANNIREAFDVNGGSNTASQSTTQNPMDTVTFTNSTNGSVTAPTYTGLTNSFTGNVFTTGSYQYTACWRWTDAQGLTHRSAPATPVTVEVTAAAQNMGAVTVLVPPLTNREVSECYCEFYRTAADGSTFYLLNPNPAVVRYGNGQWSESSTRVSFLDATSDSRLTKSEALYTTGGVLPNYSPGVVRAVSSHQGRVLVTTDDLTQLLFSKALVAGAPIEFAIENEIRVNSDEGEITGHASLDDKIVIFKEESVYIVAGSFPNELGTQSGLTPPQRIASDTGCISHTSIVLYPDGLLFKSRKGFYRLSRSLQLDYIGQAVEDYNSYTVSKAVLDTTNNEIRFFHSDTQDALVYNYLLDRWSVWDNHRADSACVYQNQIYRVDQNGKVHKSIEGTFTDTDGSPAYYSSEIELPWLKLKGLQDFQRIYMFSLLGDYKSGHTMVATVYYDYDLTVTKTYTVASTALITGTSLGDGVYQWEVKPEIQKCQAIKIKYTETPAVASTGESLDFTDVSLSVGLKRGLNKVKAAKKA